MVNTYCTVITNNNILWIRVQNFYVPDMLVFPHSRTHLYCSEVTCSLLLKDPDFTQLSPYLKGLPMDEPVSMTLETCGLLNEVGYEVYVHCACTCSTK